MAKIIQVSSYFYPAVGGVERQAEEIAARLVEKGYEVEVWATTADHKGGEVEAPPEEPYRGFVIRRFRPHLKLGHFFQTAPGLVWHALRSKFDVIHVHNLHDGHLLLLILVASLKRKKLVITGHNPFVVGAEKRGGKLNRFVKFHDSVVRFFRWGIDKYVALLDSEKEVVQRVLKLSGKKIVVIPNGIEDKYYEQQGKASRFFADWEIDRGDWQLVAGAACRMNYVKGIQNLVEVAKQLPQVLFIFAGGDDGYLEELKQKFKGLDNVLFTEKYLAGEQMLDFYAAIDVFLLPSVYEPFGMTVVEAMAQGKVVMATNNGGPPEIIPAAAGHTLHSTDKESWTKLLLEYVRQPQEIQKKGKQAQKAAQRYRWAAIIQELIRLY